MKHSSAFQGLAAVASLAIASAIVALPAGARESGCESSRGGCNLRHAPAFVPSMTKLLLLVALLGVAACVERAPAARVATDAAPPTSALASSPEPRVGPDTPCEELEQHGVKFVWPPGTGEGPHDRARIERATPDVLARFASCFPLAKGLSIEGWSSLGALAPLEHLDWLALDDVAATCEGIETLPRLASVKYFSANFCARADWKTVVARLPAIESLSLRGQTYWPFHASTGSVDVELGDGVVVPPALFDAVIDRFPRVEQLRVLGELDLARAGELRSLTTLAAPDRTLATAPSLPQVKHLEVAYPSREVDSAMLVKFPNLESLDLRANLAPGEGVIELPRLTKLGFVGTPTSHLARFARSPLEDLSVVGTITAEEIVAFPSLKRLSVAGTLDTTKPLKKLKKLEKLVLGLPGDWAILDDAPPRLSELQSYVWTEDATVKFAQPPSVWKARSLEILAMGGLANLGFVRTLPNLKNVSVGVLAKTDLSPLASLRADRLSIDAPSELATADAPDAAKLGGIHVRQLVLAGCFAGVESSGALAPELSVPSDAVTEAWLRAQLSPGRSVGAVTRPCHALQMAE